ncbi:hypothetical protein Kfla_0453 [Kribbella flavida DSM 17836]|uniref:DUF559 domain-containing protein n=1 Tax=Kribbella flavida (strain DSM 17836 / JCM 10339 / NBRC 14399) TaxID=479435 RepID=D2PUQ8_KRIFD|nr:hypothetical protein [Kribbella flavida]ADB29576.1 hypothetical protein Kfla_0453 [Kribbella flavida DSM 17836]
MAGGQGGVFSRRQALACGYSLQEIQARLTDGRWERIRYGQYAAAVDLGGMPPWERDVVRHRRLVHAAVNSMRLGSVAVSHQSALVLHGAPRWGLDLSEAQLTRLDDLRSGPTAGVRHHRGGLTPADLTEVSGLTVTTPARALTETACATSFEAAVVAADAICRSHPEVDLHLQRLLVVTEFWPGSTTARAALNFRNPLAESVGESRLRVVMHDHGLPPPTLQVPFEDVGGFIGRVDFFVSSMRTVIEFDGLTKYADGSAEILVQEKIREDRLRALGLEVVRVTWPELTQPARVVARIHQAFARAVRAA